MDIDQILQNQDGVITRAQALESLTAGALQHRLGRHWQIALPGVYVASTGTPTGRQRLRAALLYGGTAAQLADSTALAAYGVRYLPTDATVRLLLPASERRVNRDGVVIRRTHRLPRPRTIAGLPYSPPERALADLASRIGEERVATAAIADAIQRRIAERATVLEELSHVTGRGARIAHRAAKWIAAGAMSAPEADFLGLCQRSSVLPIPLVNALIELPTGQRVSPDALFEDAGLVHETNGSSAHAADDRFDNMQARHDAMTAAGLVVLHSSPRQIRTEPDRVLRDVEACYRQHAGEGLPAGVRLLRGEAA
ncbi:MAG TPA: hypothetical protein VHW74_06835 [Mycobacteriales bacterium]|jgi:hypothetical protein|nr:hypothetical protein [Mycobacteriales bacterium]